MTSVLPKGFSMLPVMRYSTVCLIGLPILASLLGVKHMLILAYEPFVSSWNQYWRFAVFQLSFLSESECVITVTLLHFALKHLERMYGSYKFASIVMWSFVYNMLAVWAVSFLCYKVLGLNLYVSSGPYGIVAGLLYMYWKSTPNIYKFELVFSGVSARSPPIKVVLTDGVFVRLLALQLFISDGIFNSVIPSAIGIAIGVLLKHELLPGKNRDFPVVVPLARRLFARKRHQRIVVEDESDDEEPANRDDEEEATPVRPLGTQLLDTFRA